MPTFDQWFDYLSEHKDTTPLSLVFELSTTLAEYFDSDVIGYFSGFESQNSKEPNKTIISDADLQGFMTCVNGLSKKDKDLILILHTPGGVVESAKRIVSYLRRIFKKRIITVVPRSAFSMGTYIACASDEIYMGPYSYLGPTDPQIFINGSQVSVDAIKKEFDQAKKELLENPNLASFWSPRLTMLAPGYINQVNNICTHMEKDLIQILGNYMFKDNLNPKIILSIYHLMSIIFNTSSTHKIIFNSKEKIFAC